MRIVSLLPAATEIVCGLGLIEQLAGVSHECDYPPAVQGITKVTQTNVRCGASSLEIDQQVRQQVQNNQALYSLNFETLKRVRPDLVVSQTLCNVCAISEFEIQTAISELAKRPAIVNLTPTRLSDIFEDIQTVANAADVAERGRQWVDSLKARVQSVARLSEPMKERPRVLLLEWLEPLFCAGHWSPELVRLAGGDEMIGREGQASRRIEWDEVYQCDPDILVIACCGFDIQRTRHELATIGSRAQFDRLRCVAQGRAYVVDGNAYFNRPGPRLVDSLELLAHLIAPSLHTLPGGALEAAGSSKLVHRL